MSTSALIHRRSLGWLTKLYRSKRFQLRRKSLIRRTQRNCLIEKLEDRHTTGAAIPLPLAMLADAINIKADLPQSDKAILRALAQKEGADHARPKPQIDLNSLPANRFEHPFQSSLFARSQRYQEAAEMQLPALLARLS